ncbi:MAG: type II CRISPR-associated endonuclease Cas1 [Comamonas sp.]
MLGRIVEIADDRRHLYVERGSLMVRDIQGERAILGMVPLDDIAAVIAHAHGLTYTNNLLVALAERGVPFVLCGPNHNAVGMLLTLDGHHVQAQRIEAQITSSLPMAKRLWASIVKAKLHNQAAVLEWAGLPTAPLAALVAKVRSGDPDNLEAQGARRYWSLLFGPDFRRDRSLAGTNALLNYGYTIARSAMARAVVAAGLHPSIGLHHSHDGNPMRLVDDLMEPYRPLVDWQVWNLCKACSAASIDIELTPAIKRQLVHVLYADLPTEQGRTPVQVCMHKQAVSLAQVLLKERKDLLQPILPAQPLSAALEAQEE